MTSRGGSTACAPDCGCRRHSPGYEIIKVVPLEVKPNKRARKCKPGCTCGRHTPKHKPDCKCNKHRQAPKQREFVPRKNANPEMCVCGHLKGRHDPFGCKTCDFKVTNKHIVDGKPAVPCHKFRSRAGYSNTSDGNAFAKEVAANGFIKHSGELATCTNCWQPIKLGKEQTLTSVIHARAHRQVCIERVRAREFKDSPNRAV